MKIEKGQVGYIQQQKKINFLWLLAFIAIGLVIFFVGYLWTHTRANVFTVLAVLMVLPAAKRVISLVVFMPRKSVERERYERIKEKAGDGILVSEYVFTSTEKIVHLDFLLIRNRHVLGVTAPSIQDRDYMFQYLKDNVHRIVPECEVKVFDNDEKLLDYMERHEDTDSQKEQAEKIWNHLRTLAV